MDLDLQPGTRASLDVNRGCVLADESLESSFLCLPEGDHAIARQTPGCPNAVDSADSGLHHLASSGERLAAEVTAIQIQTVEDRISCRCGVLLKKLEMRQALL